MSILEKSIRRAGRYYFGVLLVGFITGTASSEAPSNFEGNWSGYGYYCGSNNYNLVAIPRETVEVSHQNGKLVATKIVGDDCVTAGAVTWEVYVGSDVTIGRNYSARSRGGWPDEPNSVWMDSTIQFLSPTEIIVLTGSVDDHLTFIKR